MFSLSKSDFQLKTLFNVFKYIKKKYYLSHMEFLDLFLFCRFKKQNTTTATSTMMMKTNPTPIPKWAAFDKPSLRCTCTVVIRKHVI